ncbi:MAG: hypothetical protein WCY78_04875 [Sphaerochaetaceae bacterium]
MRTKIVILIILLLLIAMLFFFWFTKREILYVTTPSDTNFNALRWKFAKEGWVFRPLIIAPNELLNKERLNTLIGQKVRAQSAYVVCSELVSYALEGEKLKFPHSVGLANVSNFDYRMVETDRREWQLAAKGALNLALQTPLATLLLYSGDDDEAVGAARIFEENFKGALLDTLAVNESSRKQMEELATRIETRGTLLVVVPFLKNFAALLNSGPLEGVRWIVSEEYAEMVKKESLEGVVGVDLYNSLLPLLKEGRAVKGEYPLVKGYQPRRKGLQNFAL